VETKGGMVEMVATTIIITSNEHPKNWYDEKYPIAALMRRLTTVYTYTHIVEKFDTPQKIKTLF